MRKSLPGGSWTRGSRGAPSGGLLWQRETEFRGPVRAGDAETLGKECGEYDPDGTGGGDGACRGGRVAGGEPRGGVGGVGRGRSGLLQGLGKRRRLVCDTASGLPSGRRLAPCRVLFCGGGRSLSRRLRACRDTEPSDWARRSPPRRLKNGPRGALTQQMSLSDKFGKYRPY